MSVEESHELAKIDNEIKAAIRTINGHHTRLQQMGYDTKISGFDYDRPGHSAHLAGKGGLSHKLVKLDERPGGRG